VRRWTAFGNGFQAHSPHADADETAKGAAAMFSVTRLLRMAKWAHRPPSTERVLLVLGVVLVCLVLFGIERLVGWPDALAPNGPARPRILR
jgi:hypothetical protein